MRGISLRDKHLKLDQKKSTLPSDTLAWTDAVLIRKAIWQAPRALADAIRGMESFSVHI